MRAKQTIKRSFQIYADEVTCTKCALNYGALKGERTFCQEFSVHIDQKETDKNKKVARNCKRFIPDGLPRSIVKSPESDRWYEKDSMA